MQLKLYVQKQAVLASIDNTYSAKAVNHDLLVDILKNNNKITNIIVSLQCVMIVFVVIIVMTVMIFQSCSHKWPKRLQQLSTVNKYLKKKQAAIIGVAIIGFLFILYIIALDSAALGKRDNPLNPAVINDTTGIHFKNHSKDNPFTLLYEIPGIVLFFDLLGFLFSSIMIISSLFSMYFNANDDSCQCNYTFLYLLLSTLGFICSLVTHLPFIAIAYLNDAYHAGSIFIYYTIIVLISFALIEQLVVSCLKKVFDVHSSDKDIEFKGIWVLKKGPLHILSAADIPEKLQIKSGTLEVSSGKVEVNYEKIESEITLSIVSGTLQFIVSDGNNEHLQEGQPIKLDSKKLPVVQQKDNPDLKFTGLTPLPEQKFNVRNVSTNNSKMTVKVGGTILKLKKTGKVQYSSCTISCGCDVLHTKALWCLITSAVVSFVTLFTLAVVVILTCYFVIIPINRSISDAPNRLVGIYESAIVLIGAYIAYKAFFKAKKYLESSVISRDNPLTDKKSKDEWKSLSEEEKLAEFYDIIVDIIVDKRSKCGVTADNKDGGANQDGNGGGGANQDGGGGGGGANQDGSGGGGANPDGGGGANQDGGGGGGANPDGGGGGGANPDGGGGGGANQDGGSGGGGANRDGGGGGGANQDGGGGGGANQDDSGGGANQDGGGGGGANQDGGDGDH